MDLHSQASNFFAVAALVIVLSQNKCEIIYPSIKQDNLVYITMG